MKEFKEMIKIIIKSNYYSTIISELFNKKKQEIDFIKTDEFIDYLISKINIIPIPKNIVPFLDKFSLDIFLGGYGSEFFEHFEKKAYYDLILIIMKLGKQIIYTIHEGGGHFIYSYFVIISNNFYNLYSPKIRINNTLIQNESGEQVELLLFGRIIENIHLKEVLFLLNSKNHKIYNDFDKLIKGFEGPFTKLIESVSWKEIKENKCFPIALRTKNKNIGQPYIIVNKPENDAIGKYFWN